MGDFLFIKDSTCHCRAMGCFILTGTGNEELI
jgi:hypothetical protein